MKDEKMKPDKLTKNNLERKNNKCGENGEIKAVIFDMDGVLIDSETDFIRRLDKIFRARGIEPTDAQLRQLVGADEGLLDEIISQNWQQINWATVRNDFIAQCAVEPIDFASLCFQDVRPFLEWLQKAEIKIALASSSNMQIIEQVLRDCDLGKYFSTVFSADHVQRRKPHPDIYWLTAEAMQVPIEECLIVEDSEYGIEAGKVAGAGLVAARADSRFAMDQSRADFIFEDLHQLITLANWADKSSTKT